jgi:hypothetical protein
MHRSARVWKLSSPLKALVATVLLLLHVQSAWADCADLSRQAMPNKAALQAATDEYKNSGVSHLRDALNDTDPPPIHVILEGVASTTKMITALDKAIDFFRSGLDAGCYKKFADAWSGAIATFETQRDEMRRDRRTYIDILSIMAKAEEKPRKWVANRPGHDNPPPRRLKLQTNP